MPMRLATINASVSEWQAKAVAGVLSRARVQSRPAMRSASSFITKSTGSTSPWSGAAVNQWERTFRARRGAASGAPAFPELAPQVAAAAVE